MEEDNSVWEDLIAEFPFNNQEQSQNLLSILDEAKIDRFSIQLSFKQEYQQVEFMNEFKIQTEGFDYQNRKTERKRYHTFLRKPPTHPFEEVMQLKMYDTSGRMFMQLFQEEVHRIQAENNYKIYVDRNKLRIFMKESGELNMLSRNKLFQMRQQLNVLHSSDQGLIVKIRNSNKLASQLESKDIYSLFKFYRGRETGFFFSKKLILGEIERTVEQVAKYSISLFNLRSKFLTYIENASIFQILADSIADQLPILRDEYEIDVEINSNQQCLVVHEQHQCFGGQVKRQLQLMLNNIVVLSLKSKEIRTFINALRKEVKSMPFLQLRMKHSRNEVFLGINIAKAKSTAKMLQTFLVLFKLAVDAQLNVKVYFNHIQQKIRIQEIQRVMNLAEQNKLHLKNDKFGDKDRIKGVWTIRDISEYVLPKRQRQLIAFVKGLIISDPNSNNEELQSMIDSFFEENSIPSISVSKDEGIVLQRSKFHEKGKMEWLKEPFIDRKMKDIEEDYIPYILGNRRRDLQKVFENNTRGARFKIWNLQLNSKLPWPAETEVVPIFIKNAFNGAKFNENFIPLNPGSLKQKESGLVVLMSKALSLDFLPVLQLERI